MFRKLLIVSIPLLLIAGSVTTCSVLVALRDAPEKQGEGPAARLVATERVVPSSVRVIVPSQGNVSPRTQTSLVSEVSGVVESVSDDFVAGGFFREGDVLLRLDAGDYEAALKRAEAQLAAARAALAQEEARAEQARKDWSSLGRTGEPSPLVLREPYVNEARADVKAAEADLARARRDLERTRVRAPYDGLVREKAVDVGQYVAVGTRLGATFAVDYAEVRLPVSEEQRDLVDLPVRNGDAEDAGGPRVRLTATGGRGDHSWEARIVRSEGVVDPESRVVYLVARVQDPYRRKQAGDRNPRPLEIGTFVAAEIEGRRLSSVYPVPRAALNSGGELLLVDEESRLRIRPVEVTWSDRDLAYVRADLVSPVRVVTSALEAPVDGMKVRFEDDDGQASSRIAEATTAGVEAND